MQTFKEIEIQVPYGYSDRHSNGPESLIEFLSDFKKDFNYLDIDAVGWDGHAEYSRDGYLEHCEQYLKLKIKPTKEMDLSDIFHFGFFSIKNNF